MRINHIRLRALSRTSTFGVDIELQDGLNVIRADNTSGKSTCLLAIVYALGLERSLGPALKVPLPYAMRERIQVDRDRGEYEEVLQSHVMLEIENATGDVMTLRRDIEGGSDTRLVRTWSGSTITSFERDVNQRDFFLHDPGAATREHGFHACLHTFLGWELPDVPRFDGSECPLYMETLWPLFFVEQKRGWSSIQGPFPTMFRIQDLSRRVMEFVLQLDVSEMRRRYAELRREKNRLEQRWRDKVTDLKQRYSAKVRVHGLPQVPTVEFVRDPDVRVSAYYDDEWRTLDELFSVFRERRDSLDAAEARDVESAQSEITAELRKKEERYSDLSAQAAVLHHEIQVVHTEKTALCERLEAIKIDLNRNLDAEKLQKFGSEIAGIVATQACPTCHQPVEKELLPESGVRAMALEENIALLRSQLDLYRSIENATAEQMEGLEVRYESIQQELSEVRLSIRSLKNDLLRPSRSAVRSDIAEIVQLESRLSRWSEMQDAIDGSVDELQELARQWVECLEEMKRIGVAELSSTDKKKILELQKGIQEFLRKFGFLSFAPDEIVLAEDDFRPRVLERDQDGEMVEKNIGFEASASDGIRLKWAYYLGLLAVSGDFATNHLGIVVLDEPGQQQMKDVDLSAFLACAAENARRNQQVIVSTSENIDNVRKSLEGKAARIYDYSGFMIGPLL